MEVMDAIEKRYSVRDFFLNCIYRIQEDFRAAFNALREEASDMPEMTLEEINAEISAARADHVRLRHGMMAWISLETFALSKEM